MTDLMQTGAPTVVLASASAIRRTLLENAGIALKVDPGAIDEDEVKRSMRAAGAAAADVAQTLAEMKAMRTARRHPGALVFGADQMLECGDVWFDKPTDADHAAAHLAALSGKTHRLLSAVVCVRDGTRLWHHTGVATLTMRTLTPAFITRYLHAVGPKALQSVGAYQLEGLGAQLFAKVEGDYFTVLGLPLLAVLAFLREHGVVPE